ncbi:MAG: hypothetical protein Q4G19_05405 [Clostridia bacterium]|nr:hypothetical protein [Clostridia bacterium]
MNSKEPFASGPAAGKDIPFRYMFRFCCDPGFNDRQETEALTRFIPDARIDDVTVFANVEEINTGHMTFEEQDQYLALMRDLSAALAGTGVTLSVNQWHSVMHADLGKRLKDGQHFRLMVDPEGHEASLCVCPLCRDWQAYIGRVYARYADLDAFVLWVEDDFRLHNHDPLVWGGCFCEEHMRLYSEAAGKKLTREEFVRGLLQPGPVHPYRKIWLDVSRETMLSAARAIHDAVRAVSSSSRIGLMSSVPYVHAAEGRSWPLLLNTLSEGQPPVCRIHLPAYQEQVPSVYIRNFNMVSMQCAAFLPVGTEIYPELENYPYSLFSKSLRFTRFQLLSSLPLGLRGMTIDLFDLNGNGIVPEENYQQMLSEVKPFLIRMQETGIFASDGPSVRILCSQDSSATLHTPEGTRMEELYPQEVFFAGLLPSFGIPVRYTEDINISGQAVALSGQVLRNYTEREITGLFERNTVILNGDAIETLCDLGLGRLAGIREIRVLPQNGGGHTYEQVTNGKIFRGRPAARASTVISCSDVLDIRFDEDADVAEYTAFHDSFRARTASAQVCVNNRVILFPFCHFDGPQDIPPMLRNTLRQELMQDMLRRCGAGIPMVIGHPDLVPYSFRAEEGTAVYLVNASMDDAHGICLETAEEVLSVSAISSRGEDRRNVPFRRENGRIMLADVTLPPMEAILIVLKTKED